MIKTTPFEMVFIIREEMTFDELKEKAHSLNNGHHGKHHAYRAGSCSIIEHSHEKGVCHIVKRCDQHTDDAGKGQSQNQRADGSLCHLLIFGFVGVCHS